MIKLNIQRFGHTNSTTNYELPQFVGTDKPQWLTDINQSYLTIDTAIHNAYALANLTSTNLGDISDLTTTVKTDVVSAVNEINGGLGNLGSTVASHTTAIGNNTTAIGNLADLDTVDKQDLVGAINEVDLISTNNSTKIGNLTSLDTTEKSNLVGAINEVKEIADLINKFNLTNFTTLTRSSTNNISTIHQDGVILATNSDGSIFKLYGYISYRATAEGSCSIVYPSSLRPTENYTIANSIVSLVNHSFLANAVINVYTNGNIEISFYGDGDGQITLPACIYFNKNFGDTPTP